MAPRATHFIFDDSLAATLPTPAPGTQPGTSGSTHADPNMVAEYLGLQLHSFREPARLDDIPADLRPHFRKVVRKRPAPLPVDEVWAAVKGGDKISKRAAKNGFDPSVDVSFSLFIDARKSDQLVRGTVTLPHGTGKDRRVAVFAAGGDAVAARNAGAVIVGAEDLVARVAEDKGLDVDVVVATPDMVPRLSKVARILGPRGLMPNPKFGTVTTQVAEAVLELRKGKLQFRNDKGGTVSCTIGRKSFSDAALTDNFYAVLHTLMDLRPRGVKGSDIQGYIERVSVSTTQGKGFPIAEESLTLAERMARSRGGA